MTTTRTIPDPMAVTDQVFYARLRLNESQKDVLNALINSLNLNKNQSNTPPFPWDYVKAALLYREDNYGKFREAMIAMNAVISDTNVAQQFLDSIGEMKGKFIALFSANKIDPGSYHTYPHGVEMSTDPGEFSASYYRQNCASNFEARLWLVMVDAIGAAHDIIQGKAPPINERESAVIFIDEMQKMMNNFIEANKNNLTTDQKAALEKFRDNAIPFLANECLINATYLLFNSGKRDFSNILHQVHEIISPNTPEFYGNTKLAAAVMSVALSDTRRSEMHHVLEKQELLKSVPGHLVVPLESVLRMVGLLAENERITDLRAKNSDKLADIEGFLLRIGQNIRMSTELAGVFKKSGVAERLNILQQARVAENDTFNVGVDIQKHLQPFLDCLCVPFFGEAAFAKALGEIDQTELIALAKAQGISSLVEGKLDLKGWQSHALLLENLHKGCEQLKAKPDELQKITQVLIFIASKPPGYKITPEIYKAMQAELRANQDELRNLENQITKIKFYTSDPLGKDKISIIQQQQTDLDKKVNSLQRDIAEIERTNPMLRRESDKTVMTMPHPENVNNNQRL